MVKSNSADAFKVQYNTLILTGIWPIENPNVIYRIKTILSWVSALGLSGVMLTQLIHDITDFTKLSETLYILLAYMGFIVKLVVFMYRRKEFLNVINFLKNPIFLSYPEDLDHYMAKSINQSVRLAKIFQPFAVSFVIFYAVYPILDNTSLPFPFPYDLGKYRMVMYCSQLISEGMAAINNMYIDTICTSLMGIIAAQLDILTEKIMRLNENDGTVEDHAISNEVCESIYEKLKDCVKHHLAIIKLVNCVEEVFTIALFGQFLTSAMIICNTIFEIILIPTSTKQILLVEYLFGALVQLFMYCWYGNEIIVKSLQIKDACFMSKWYAFDKKACKYLFIIMERSKRPLRISAIKLSTLSLTAFGTILQWSYSYLTLLLELYRKQSLPLQGN
ncbi:hypothetical protein ILUMI_02071 [Ignelater luminosus]|uniref:Odorant receptor n=1 Tax=Ignelater luminosus TaxID=2038154 RepID=A0A8K0DDE8_IGNLU|nr:hypothetical protein ILUMI_02071 [Ignelater luminosus]